VFIGEYQHAIDSKGRLFIPARFREGLGDKFILTKGLDGCLFVYPPKEWTALEQKMRSLPFTRADARAFVRFFFSGATECEVDKQGRILIPASLREYSGLEKETMVVGIASRVEIWSKQRWEEYNSSTSASAEQLAEKIVEFDLGL
jgi:MraZ protein